MPFDQTEHAALESAEVDLTANTTQHLVADMEALRRHLGADRRPILGGSRGSTLSLTYAEAHPERVTALILWGIKTGRRAEFDWPFRSGGAALFPEQWERNPHYHRETDTAETLDLERLADIAAATALTVESLAGV